MNSWHSYPKVFALGHKAIADLLDGPVIVQEKVDGSQLSFGKGEGKLWIRSRGRVFDIDAPDQMFSLAAQRVKDADAIHGLTPGWTYRGEYLNKPKHNALQYDRVPNGNIILFDVSTGPHEYASSDVIATEAARLGFESVPLLWTGNGLDLTPMMIDEFLTRNSCLGGMIEGVVVKNYARFSVDGHAMMGKYVSEKFKEVHKREWTKDNPAPKDILSELSTEYRTEARWIKALQHLREAGVINGEPADIGPLLNEIRKDVVNECQEEIKAKLWSWCRKKFLDQIIRGAPEWYKKQLLEGQFASSETP